MQFDTATWTARVGEIQAGADPATLTDEVCRWAYERAGRQSPGDEHYGADVWMALQSRLPRIYKTFDCSSGRGFITYVRRVVDQCLLDLARRYAVATNYDQVATQDYMVGTWFWHAPRLTRRNEDQPPADLVDPASVDPEGIREPLDLRQLSPAMIRAMLIAALKNDAPYSRITELAHAAGEDPADVDRAWRELRAVVHERRYQRIQMLRRRRDRAHSFVEAARLRLRQVEHYQLREQIEKYAARWERCRNTAIKELRGVRQHATHAEVARALRIPKGTIDSAIRRLQHELQPA